MLSNHIFIILMVRYSACNSKAVSFSSICICPEKVYKPKLIFYSISQPNHLHLLLYNNFTKLYTVFNKFLKFLLLTSFISVFCFFLLTTRVELVNYTSRANIYLSLPSVFYQLNYPAFGHLTSRQGWT